MSHRGVQTQCRNEHTKNERFNHPFGNETARIYLWQVVEKLRRATVQEIKDTVLAAKLATQLGQVDEDVTRLHAAELDLRKLNNVSTLVASNLGKDNPSGQVCNGKSCAGVPAFEAIIGILTAGLVEELNKKQPFGPNNEIMKSLHAVGDFVQCIFGCK